MDKETYNKLIYEGATTLFAGVTASPGFNPNTIEKLHRDVVESAKMIAKLAGIEPAEHMGMSGATIGEPIPVCRCNFPATCTGYHIRPLAL